MKIVELFENVEDWDENQVVKMFDLYDFYVKISDVNMKAEISKEILEEIESVMAEFTSGNIIRSRLEKIKSTMEKYGQ